jgi:hypothetical protein
VAAGTAVVKSLRSDEQQVTVAREQLVDRLRERLAASQS